MKSVTALSAALLLGSLFAGSASASSIIMLGDQLSNSRSSIVRLGDPDPCADNACDAQDELASAGSDSNAALVDAFGMPTNMPVIMRPSMDTPPAPPTSTAAVTPPAAPATATQQPAQQPAPVVQHPKAEPAPAVEQPVAEGQQQMPQNGQPIER